MFKLAWSPEARQQYDAIKQGACHAALIQVDKKKSSRQVGLFKQALKALQLLAANPRHPGLNTHKYSTIKDPSGQRREVFEAYVQNQTPGAYRIFWCYGPNKGEITILAITPHP